MTHECSFPLTKIRTKMPSGIIPFYSVSLYNRRGSLSCFRSLTQMLFSVSSEKHADTFLWVFKSKLFIYFVLDTNDHVSIWSMYNIFPMGYILFFQLYFILFWWNNWFIIAIKSFFIWCRWWIFTEQEAIKQQQHSFVRISGPHYQ